ncbi:MAG: protein kinase [Acidobacteria bacterium]|nr:protein kinase [Acidobacteriota bacterium]
MIGKTLGHYAIVSLLGKGGMGEVYRATDLRLGRDVAIKVLPAELAEDAGRLARFEQEAKALAALNNPNIAAIYGLEEWGGIHFIVLELVEGETLADAISQGPLPVEESLELALQIAEALAAAHAKGIIHRDLKPANIKVTPNGRVKVLDFGMAKAMPPEQTDVDRSQSSTRSPGSTLQGWIVGTPAYMAPEQARGQGIDKRADIWAFGVVLFEMLSGKRLFAGDTLSDTIAMVLTREPDFSSLPVKLHPENSNVLSRCLEKDPRNRFHDIADARIEIEGILSGPRPLLPRRPAPPGAITALLRSLPLITAIAAAALITGTTVWRIRTPEPREVVRFTYEIPAEQKFGTYDTSQPLLAVSPDGALMAYCTPGGIYLHRLDEADARLVPGVEPNPRQPFFSPDGRWIGYWSEADGLLKKIPVDGGTPVSLTDEAPVSYLSWNGDDTILYAGPRGITRIPAAGGKPETLIRSEEVPFFSPRLLPDGKHVIFTLGSAAGRYLVVAQSLVSGERKILAVGSDAWYCPTGHLVYLFQKNLVAVPFEADTLEIKGGQVSMVEDVSHKWGAPHYALAAGGTLVYMHGSSSKASFSRTLHWIDQNGGEEPLGAPPDAYTNPRISPDGSRVALCLAGSLSAYNIHIWDPVRAALVPRTFDQSVNISPLWAPDGRWIAFHHQMESDMSIGRIAVDGPGNLTGLYARRNMALMPECWSGDGKTLLVTVDLVGSSNFDIAALSLQGGTDWKPLLQEKHNELQPRLSPDGRWLAYTSDASGAEEVWVCPFPAVDTGRTQISRKGGNSPLWSPDGEALFYRCGDEVMAVSVSAGAHFSHDRAHSLFRGDYVTADTWVGSLGLQAWDIHPRSRRFLMMKEAGPAATTPHKINIVLNWFEELKLKGQ